MWEAQGKWLFSTRPAGVGVGGGQVTSRCLWALLFVPVQTLAWAVELVVLP